MVAVIRSGWARGREVRWWQSFAVGGHGERGEVAAVIRSGWARGREVMWWQSFAVGGHVGER